MIGVAKQAGLMKGNKLPRAHQALLADSVATAAGAMFGTSPTSAYIESSSGVAVGGRTGLTTLTVSILFICRRLFLTACKHIIRCFGDYRSGTHHSRKSYDWCSKACRLGFIR